MTATPDPGTTHRPEPPIEPPIEPLIEPRVLATIAAGGIVGSLGRYALGLALPDQAAAGGWPMATFLVNVTGSFAMGVLVAHLLARPGGHPLLRPFAAVGVLGGWTTFSSFAVDVVQLTEAGHPGLAGAYVAGSFVASVLAIGVGSLVGQRIWAVP